ncbi:TetR/AcrR family transcriptional regulator [Sphingobium chlorophenolicum]|uniref:Regulatory protein TetR n=1 Tax=Sphingobium chlorophenolicum TaxID=46429 RepID=A0A081RA10_SPHCR|nr:TetR/AcrR family transcriptional regulator [Sphingobium chlorophenolicum]KEQ52033.1 Regulatory protein TetR [Sphingobium chlorophenolicum]
MSSGKARAPIEQGTEEAEKAAHPAKTKRVRRRQPEEVRARILRAALNAFANFGFDGASTRAIAADAHVSISLLLYHFSSKDELWKAVMTDIMDHIRQARSPNGDIPGATATEKLKLLIDRTVRFFAEYPALHRLMTLEGHQLSDRLIYLCESYVKDEFRMLCGLILDAQKEGTVIDVDPARLRIAITAVAAVPFSVAAEYQYLTKQSPFTTKEIEGTIDMINRLVFKSPEHIVNM